LFDFHIPSLCNWLADVFDLGLDLELPDRQPLDAKMLELAFQQAKPS
jgi:hypothetical protein